MELLKSEPVDKFVLANNPETALMYLQVGTYLVCRSVIEARRLRVTLQGRYPVLEHAKIYQLVRSVQEVALDGES